MLRMLESSATRRKETTCPDDIPSFVNVFRKGLPAQFIETQMTSTIQNFLKFQRYML